MRVHTSQTPSVRPPPAVMGLTGTVRRVAHTHACIKAAEPRSPCFNTDHICVNGVCLTSASPATTCKRADHRQEERAKKRESMKKRAAGYGNHRMGTTTRVHRHRQRETETQTATPHHTRRRTKSIRQTERETHGRTRNTQDTIPAPHRAIRGPKLRRRHKDGTRVTIRTHGHARRAYKP